MAVFSPTNAKVHFKAYDGSFTDALGTVSITQNNGVAMSSAQKLFGQNSMFMANFSDSITFAAANTFDVGSGDYTVGFWFHPTQLTSYDRLFATGPDSSGNPLRIYNHNGAIGVYVENDDEVPGDANHDLIINYYLGAGAANQWWHIMVQRNSGTTKLYINGTEQGSSTVSYEIDNSSSPTLGADINAAATGVKGYIQDFFWTEEAVSFSQADFDPSTPEPVTFHNGNPSISSFSTSANSVENSGDTVTLSWSVAGETKLELLKYVSGILSNTEDVLGLSSKTVTITETVSYKLRATNDNSAVDSASVQITLNGGDNMSAIGNNSTDNLGLVIQKEHIRTKSDFAGALLVNGGGILDNVVLNSALSSVLSQDASIALSGAQADSSIAASQATAIGTAFATADTSVALSGAVAVGDARAAFAAADTAASTAASTALLGVSQALDTEESARATADTSVVTARTSLVSSLALSGAQADSSIAVSQATAIGTAFATADTSVALSGAVAVGDARAAFAAADTAASTAASTALLGVSQALDTEESARATADTSVVTARTSLVSSLALSGAQADASLQTLINSAVQWNASNRTLQIGDNVEFVFENYSSGFSAGDAVALEIKYKA